MDRDREESRTYLKVGFQDKDRAKALGARWDPDQKQWYAPASRLSDLQEWMPDDSAETRAMIAAAGRDPKQKKLSFSGGKLLVQAKGGKTMLLADYAATHPQLSFLYLCYNKAVQEAKRREFLEYGLRHVDVKTPHALAFGAVSDWIQRRRIGDLWDEDIVAMLGVSSKKEVGGPGETPDDVMDALNAFYASADRSVGPGHAKGSASVQKAAQTVWDLIAGGQGEKVPHSAYVKQLQLQALSPSSPALQAFANYDVLLIDEAHDLTACQLSIFQSAHAQGRVRSIVVYDPHQCIYGFRGAAGCATLEHMSSDFPTFPLSRTFRYGAEVATLANSLIGAYKRGRDHLTVTGNPHRRTTVRGLDVGRSASEGRKWLYHEVFGSGSGHLAVLCRSNFRLWQEASQAALSPLVAKIELKSTSFDNMLGRLGKLANEGLKGASTLRKKADLYQKVGNKLFAEEAKLVMKAGPRATLDLIHAVGEKRCVGKHIRGGVVELSSVHTAKGLGFDNVFLAGDFLGADDTVFSTHTSVMIAGVDLGSMFGGAGDSLLGAHHEKDLEEEEVNI
eukprot:g3612.t1